MSGGAVVVVATGSDEQPGRLRSVRSGWASLWEKGGRDEKVSAPSEMVYQGGVARVLVQSPSEMADGGGFVPVAVIQAPSAQPPSELANGGGSLCKITGVGGICGCCACTGGAVLGAGGIAALKRSESCWRARICSLPKVMNGDAGAGLSKAEVSSLAASAALSLDDVAGIFISWGKKVTVRAMRCARVLVM